MAARIAKATLAEAALVQAELDKLSSPLRAVGVRSSGSSRVDIQDASGNSLGDMPSDKQYWSEFLHALPVACTPDQFMLASSLYELGHEHGSGEGYYEGMAAERYNQSVFG